MNAAALPRVLCVDDDARLLEGLVPHMRREYQFHTALGGQEALKIMQEIGGAAVVVSDMRMPMMDGAAFLNRVANLYPTATRILLTGEPGRDGAVRAINEGQIFRFLTKPCPPQELKSAINAGVKQHELITAERVLLQETLVGSIRALMDVLAMTHPVAFGRASRLKQMALDLAAKSGAEQVWQLEAAALLSQLGYLSLPAELVEKLYRGVVLSADERAAANEVPQVAKRLLHHIPRLDNILLILDALNMTPETRAKLPKDVAAGAAILSLVLEYDALSAQGHTASAVFDKLRSRGAQFDSGLIDLLAGDMNGVPQTGDIRELQLRDIKAGMVLMNDLHTEHGSLLVPRGFEISPSFLERMRNFGAHKLSETVKVRMPQARVNPPASKNTLQ